MRSIKFFWAAAVFVASVAAAPSFAATTESFGTDGFAPLNYRDFAVTTTMLGGVDIQDMDVADAYAEINYCSLYQRKYLNDLEWHDIRKDIIMRVTEKKDSYRTLFQTDDTFIIGRYDPVKQSFSLDRKSVMNDVGTLALDVERVFYCTNEGRVSSVYSRGMRVLLSQPISLQEIRVPVDEAKRILPLLRETKDGDRILYARIRFRVTGATQKVHQVGVMQLAGEMVSLDFFLDKALTMPVTVLR